MAHVGTQEVAPFVSGFFLRGSDGLMQIIALRHGLALRGVLERLVIQAQSLLPQGALFFHPTLTLGEHIRLAARCDDRQAACLPSVGSPSRVSSLTRTLGRACCHAFVPGILRWGCRDS